MPVFNVLVKGFIRPGCAFHTMVIKTAKFTNTISTLGMAIIRKIRQSSLAAFRTTNSELLGRHITRAIND